MRSGFACAYTLHITFFDFAGQPSFCPLLENHHVLLYYPIEPNAEPERLGLGRFIGRVWPQQRATGWTACRHAAG